jgi:hypothetical protein
MVRSNARNPGICRDLLFSTEGLIERYPIG